MTNKEKVQELTKLAQARIVARCPECYDWEELRTAAADLYTLGTRWPNKH